MNTSPTFPAGNSLHGIRDMIDTHVMPPEGGPTDPLQSSPAVQRGNRHRAKFVLDAIRPEDMAEFLADYLIARFGKVRASFIGRDIAQKAETRK